MRRPSGVKNLLAQGNGSCAAFAALQDQPLNIRFELQSRHVRILMEEIA